jgi:hypothetical protein
MDKLELNNKNRYLFMNLWDQMASIYKARKNSSVTIKYLYYLNILEAF